MEFADTSPEAVDPVHLKQLVLRYGDAFAERLRVYAGVMVGERARRERPEPPRGIESVPLEEKIHLADQLGGSLLARMAVKKLARRLAGKAPPRG